MRFVRHHQCRHSAQNPGVARSEPVGVIHRNAADRPQYGHEQPRPVADPGPTMVPSAAPISVPMVRCAARCTEPAKLVCMTAKPLIAAHHVFERCNAFAKATESATESIASVPNVARSLEGFQAANSRPSDDMAARLIWTSVIHASAVAYVYGGEHRAADLPARCKTRLSEDHR